MQRILLSITAALLIAGCNQTAPKEEGHSNGAAKPTTEVLNFRIAAQKGASSSPMLYAKAKGYVEEELKKDYPDVKVTWSIFPHGPAVNESFAAGQQDVGLAGNVPTTISKASGQKTVIFAKAAGGPAVIGLIVHKDSPVKVPADLKGKSVACVRGGFSHHLLYLILKEAGLTFKDVYLVNLPNADIGTAVETKQVDAGVIWEPGLSKTLSNGQTIQLRDGAGFKSNGTFYYVTESFAQKNPKALSAFVRAIGRAAKEIKENPAAGAEVVKSEMDVPIDVLTKLYSKYDFRTELNQDDIDELKDVEKFLSSEGLIKNRVDVDKFVVPVKL
ncbi:nitrate ABC transporter substrate-binding protein [Planctomycetales bacterium]|nr:nitrate ABC transporter substrate-binding protein [Planctomycetales bacterium]